MAGLPPGGERPPLDGARLSRHQMADRYLLPPLAALVGAALRLYPAKGHLRALAAWLVRTDAPQPSDVIVVLGGGSRARARTGAALYARGLAPAVYLSTDVDRRELVGTGARSSYDLLRRAAVPAAAIVHDRRPRTTSDEARRFAALARRVGWRSALVVTDPYHTRRARQAFVGAGCHRRFGVDLRVIGSGHDWPPIAGWWRSRAACTAILGEYIGLLVQLVAERPSRGRDGGDDVPPTSPPPGRE